MSSSRRISGQVAAAVALLAVSSCATTAGADRTRVASTTSATVPTRTVVLRAVVEPGCAPYTVLAAYSIAADGRLVPVGVDPPRTITGLIRGDGIEVVEKIPHGGQTDATFVPDGYRPRTASAASRALYGIPARPHGPGAAAYWDQRWDHRLYSRPSVGCSLLGVHSDGITVSPARG